MSKYLVIGSYTAEGAKGVLKEGGTGRAEAARRVAESVGGKLESIYWGFGTDDYYVIVDVPSNAAAAAISLTVGASGSSRTRTVVLMTPEEVDAATRISPAFRAPGA